MLNLLLHRLFSAIHLALAEDAVVLRGTCDSIFKYFCKPAKIFGIAVFLNVFAEDIVRFYFFSDVCTYHLIRFGSLPCKSV